MHAIINLGNYRPYTAIKHFVDALIKAPLKNNYDPQRRLVWSAKNYFGPLGAPCLERRL